jgi:hypothetical protein
MPILIMIGSGLQKLIAEGTHTHTDRMVIAYFLSKYGNLVKTGSSNNRERE